MTTPPHKSDERRAQVIEAATELFWRKGYDGVSIGDVVEATGMNRYALYQAFGGKKEIFMAVLHSYVSNAREMIRGFLARPNGDPVDAARDSIVAKMLDPTMFPAGCLMCTTAVDVAAKDEDVAALMAECSAEIGKDFADAYAKAQKAGIADPNRDPASFAEIANALYFSTGVQARMGRSREDLLEALEKVIDSLRYKTSP